MDTSMQFTINSFRQLLPDKIFSLTIPRFSVKSLTFPWQLSHSMTFPGFPDKWSPCLHPTTWNSFMWLQCPVCLFVYSFVCCHLELWSRLTTKVLHGHFKEPILRPIRWPWATANLDTLPLLLLKEATLAVNFVNLVILCMIGTWRFYGNKMLCVVAAWRQ